jgi:hypothetical protein
MNRGLLHVVPAPSVSPRWAPWCLGYVEYDDDVIVAAVWWDDRPFADRVVRRQDTEGVLADGLVDPDNDLPAPGWAWWIVGEETPWPHDPRVLVANVHAVGPGSPAEAITALLADLTERPAPTFSREQSLALLAQQLPWYPAAAPIANALDDADGPFGSGTVVRGVDDE